MHHELSAVKATRQISEGRITSVDLVKSCLSRIEDTDDQIRAWAFIDKEYALAQAEEMDQIRRSGRPIGALHGVPVGLKDIIDTSSLPTERGSPIFIGRQPDADAAIVGRLKEAGAVILGKTVTAELAFAHAGATRNPHNLEHSPGGSSSGSAAAVAALQVPLAIGTQTNGSIIRPASYCGTYGLKPTRGMISRQGLLQTSKSLDQVGTFGRSLEDVALIADVISCYDAADALSYARPRPNMLKGARAKPPVEPDLVWFELPFCDRLNPDASQGYEEVLSALDARVERLPAPPAFASLVAVQHTIHEYEICQHLGEQFNKHWDKVSATLQPIIERGRTISDEQYGDALGMMASACEFFDTFYNDYDAIIAPSAPGEAPKFGGGTGDPIFSTIWTLAGLPCLTLPLLVGENDLPVGVQLIGAAEEDDRLLRTASWLVGQMQCDAD